jgi:hypothetical protein
MKVYALRTCRGQWAVCSDEGVLSAFESYDEATCTARSVVSVSNPEEHPTIGVRRAPPPHDRDTEDERGGPGRTGGAWRELALRRRVFNKGLLQIRQNPAASLGLMAGFAEVSRRRSRGW